jgi:hypothetical protein
MSYRAHREDKDAQVSSIIPQNPVRGKHDCPDEAYKQYFKPMRGAHAEIALAACVISLPLVGLSAMLLGLVYYYRVSQNSLLSPDLQLRQPDAEGHDAYLVRFSATKLITLASWTSSVAPLLPAWVMTLMSYPAAKEILEYSRTSHMRYLPTPYQLNLYLGALTGGVGSLWNWIRYGFWRRRERLVPAVSTTVAGLMFAILIG